MFGDLVAIKSFYSTIFSGSSFSLGSGEAVISCIWEQRYSFYSKPFYFILFYFLTYIMEILICFMVQYCDKYGDNVGFPHLEEWRKMLCKSAIISQETNLENFRDTYDDHQLLQEALQSPHFTQYGPQAFPL